MPADPLPDLALAVWTLAGRLLARGGLSAAGKREVRTFARDLARSLAGSPPAPPQRLDPAAAREILYALLDALTDGGAAWSDLAAWVNTYARQRPGWEV